MRSVRPVTFVIFGATGDLARRKLIPALALLKQKKLLPAAPFSIVGFSRRPWDSAAYRKFLLDEVVLPRRDGSAHASLIELLDQTSYVEGQFDAREGYMRLADALGEVDRGYGVCSEKLFYLSTPPAFYETILGNIEKSGLAIPCADDGAVPKILVEKPFGRDADAAARLDRLLGKLFDESQIFRIDHYLAKEALQNILAFRFGNTLFEPVWNKKHIESISVRMWEAGRVLGRGELYMTLGALRDVGQNHVLQMLAAVTMERPAALTGEDVRRKRAHVLKSLRLLPRSNPQSVIRAQYREFGEDAGVEARSEVETYFRVEGRIQSERLRGVPLVLEGGKGLPSSFAEVAITFKPAKFCLPDPACLSYRNAVVFRLQPEEKISIQFFVRDPRGVFELREEELSFKGRTDFLDRTDAYERVILDCLSGDQTLFASTKEIRYSWRFIESVLRRFRSVPLLRYRAGEEPPHANQC